MTDEPGLRAALGKLHHSPRCPAQWRCKSPLPGERGACCGGHGYKTVEERDADIAAHSEIYSGTEAEIRAALLTPAASDGSLDVAWAAAEAALPEGWRPRFTLQRGDDVSPLSRTWHATAEDVDDERAGRIGSGPTPAAALTKLAARLSEYASEGKTE